MIRWIAMTLLLAGTAGCATNLQKADRFLAQGQFAEARRFYQIELDQQRKSAELPRWTGREYRFQFSPVASSKAILGVGNVDREMDRPESALYQYSYFIQYCLRHDLKADAEVAEIERWIKDSGLGMPMTKVEIGKPKSASKRVAPQFEAPPEASTPPAMVFEAADAAPPSVRKGTSPGAQEKLAKMAKGASTQSANTAEETDHADAPIHW